MSHAALTAKYRPQTFAQVAGQETIKAILSRASLERRVAPAYLFSGTRGVGKTTLARIFAKALNCRTAPANEPCNACDQCRAITLGGAVDVVEIDGASNRGIDDVRRLREVVGYAPMEGGYKIFIIDEAHMLSREAFNALLKTLEEPPARVTFIMATTEPHKFPATIISRCQHFVFKPLPESALLAHLGQVLAAESLEYDESALRLIARRGAGSVRDAMSLLGQVLALGSGRLTEASARSVLGLAGQEAFIGLLEAVKGGDSVAISTLLRDLLEQGLDMGFFLREMASLWRNLFMLRQSGEQALAVVDLPENEARRYLEISQDFSLQHIHACWQMTLEGQRRVLTSLEPALALELLLLNIGMLPQLLALENMAATGRKGPAPAPSPASAPSGGSTPIGTGTSPAPLRGAAPQASARSASGIKAGALVPTRVDQAEEARFDHVQTRPEAGSGSVDTIPCAGHAVSNASGSSDAPLFSEAGQTAQPLPAEHFGPAKSFSGPAWEGIFAAAEAQEAPPWFVALLRRLEARWEQGRLLLEAQDGFTLERLNEAPIRQRFEALLQAWCGAVPPYVLAAKEIVRKSREALKAEIMGHSLVQDVQKNFGGHMVDYGQLR